MYMTPFEKHQYDQKKQEDSMGPRRQRLDWSRDILARKSNEPRAPRESPLKEWWLQQQTNKTINSGDVSKMNGDPLHR